MLNFILSVRRLFLNLTLVFIKEWITWWSSSCPHPVIINSWKSFRQLQVKEVLIPVTTRKMSWLKFQHCKREGAVDLPPWKNPLRRERNNLWFFLYFWKLRRTNLNLSLILFNVEIVIFFHRFWLLRFVVFLNSTVLFGFKIFIELE